jgi:molybdopterin converting factor small subunit
LGVSLPGVPTRLECEGSTVAEALADCVAREPRLKGRIFRQDGTLWVGVSLNGSAMSQEAALRAGVADGDVIGLVPAVGSC